MKVFTLKFGKIFCTFVNKKKKSFLNIFYTQNLFVIYTQKIHDQTIYVQKFRQGKK